MTRNEMLQEFLEFLVFVFTFVSFLINAEPTLVWFCYNNGNLICCDVTYLLKGIKFHIWLELHLEMANGAFLC